MQLAHGSLQGTHGAGRDDVASFAGMIRIRFAGVISGALRQSRQRATPAPYGHHDTGDIGGLHPALMAIVSVTEFKAKAARIFEALSESEDEIVLTQNGRASAVVQSVAAHRQIRESLLVLKLVAQGEADAAAGRTIPQEQLFRELAARVRQSDG